MSVGAIAIASRSSVSDTVDTKDWLRSLPRKSPMDMPWLTGGGIKAGGSNEEKALQSGAESKKGALSSSEVAVKAAGKDEDDKGRGAEAEKEPSTPAKE